MIPRYTPKIMSDLWSDEAKWARVLEVELAVADVLAEDKVIPAEAADVMRRNASFDTLKIDEYEQVMKHDVLAFLASVGDSLGEYKRWLHLGLTSSDVLDTALGIALHNAGLLITERLYHLHQVLVIQAKAHKNTLIAGRTHGVHAEPTTVGWKICGWIAECDRDIERLKRAIDTVSVGKLSGAVGTFSHLSPAQEERVCTRLGLGVEPVATQAVSRDRHAEFISVLAIIGGLVERIALEIRLLQHSEVEEASESFSPGQRGSSAMPHKKNPIAAENMCGLVRLLRSYTIAAYEDIALWHERDISHSSVERVILPDATSLCWYLLDRVADTIQNWSVDADRMLAHIEADMGLMASGNILTALKQAGISDEDIYRRVQTLAMLSRKVGIPLVELIRKDAEISTALGDKIDSLFDNAEVLKRTYIPFGRLGIE